MTCNCFEYKKMVDKLFYGVLLTDEHLNNAIEQIRRYIVDNGAAPVADALNIGLKIAENPRTNEIVRIRFVYIGGKNKGRELERHEIENIGMFLKYGEWYGKYGIPAVWIL